MTEQQQYFFDRLNTLGTGERAALRREVGCLLRVADGRAITAFYRCLPPGINIQQEDRWFAIACLRCLWDAGEEGGIPLEQVISSLIRSDDLSSSTEHRVELLLDTAWDTDGYLLTKLSRLVKLIRQKSDRARIDFAALLEDLLSWNSGKQFVQRKWARTVFSNVNDIKLGEKEM